MSKIIANWTWGLSEKTNWAVAYASFAGGALTGLVLGLWSFDGPFEVPAWIGDYGSGSRRLIRLGHIAFFGLAILNLFVVRDIPKFTRPGRTRRLALGLMNLGNVLLPLNLLGAGAYSPLKYLLPFPALSVFSALTVTAVCVIRSQGWETHGAKEFIDVPNHRTV